MKVFISYSSKDGRNYAEKLRDTLEKRGHAPFLVDHDACASENLWDVIAKDCLNCDITVFLVTPSSQESRGQKQEYDLVVCNYRDRMSFVREDTKNALGPFPFLQPQRRLEFNDSNFEQLCDELSSQLVTLQDKKKEVEEGPKTDEDGQLPELSTEGLDKSEVDDCIRKLNASFKFETIIPEAFRTIPHDKKTSDLKFVNIGIHHRLPREWFLTNQPYANDLIFQEFGRTIALGEQKYNHESASHHKRDSSY